MPKPLTPKQIGSKILEGMSKFKQRAGHAVHVQGIGISLMKEGLTGEEIEAGFDYLEEQGFIEGDKHLITEAGYEAMPY